MVKVKSGGFQLQSQEVGTASQSGGGVRRSNSPVMPRCRSASVAFQSLHEISCCITKGF